MADISLTGRSFLKESDFTIDEWQYLIALSADLKAQRHTANVPRYLVGKSLALLFDKTSTRTRCAFEVAAFEQGAGATYLDRNSSQLGHKESVADTAAVLGRMYAGIQYRGSDQRVVETLAEHAGVPVFNGLTDDWHPTQSLCDVLTMREHKPQGPISLCYVGDGRNNVAHSLMVGSTMAGFDVTIVAPSSLQPTMDAVKTAEQFAELSGGSVRVTDDVTNGVSGVDFVHTDVWVSMGEPHDVWAERIELLRSYQVNAELMALAAPTAKFMHCLPAFHNLETDVGREVFEATGLKELEVTDDVFRSTASVVFDQAENRMHTIKAVMVATMADDV